MIRNFLPFALLLTLISCTSDKEGTKSSGSTSVAPVANGLSFKIQTDSFPKGLQFSDLEMDTVQTKEGAQAIKVAFDLKASPEALNELKKEGFSSYFIDLKCFTPEGKSYIHRDELFQSPAKKKFLHSNRDCFISHSSDRRIEIFIPFRNLEMKQGEKEVSIDIEAFPAKFEDESSSLNMKVLKGISGDARGKVNVKTTIKAPKLYRASLTVLKTRLDTKIADPGKFDLAGKGKGYPDIFWEVHCGNDYLYNSPVEKNKVEYTQKHTSPSFLLSEKDVAHLGVVDYDNGPFNTQDDVIGNWKFHVRDLKNNAIDTLRFDKLEYLIMQAKVEEVI